MNPLLTFVIIFGILILINAFFSAIEIAFISLSENKINLEVKKNISKALKIKKIKEKPNYFLSVIQIVIHIITFCQGFFIGEYLKNNQQKTILFLSFNIPISDWFINFSVIVFSIVFGEILPKRISLAFPLKIAYLFVGTFRIFYIIVMPFVWALNQFSNIILYLLQKIFKIDFNKKNDAVTEDELRFLLTSSYAKGIINSNENNMIQNIFDFSDTVVSDVMRHRKEIIAINSNITKEELIQFISREKYTRFPVYEKDIDHIIGIVHVKDIFKGLFQTQDIIENAKGITKKFDIRLFLRKPYYVMEFKNISKLFKEMQLKQNHIAIVLDEYGGTAGIITIEDVIEEILGDIQDEYDKQNVEILKISQKEYIAKGTTHLYEIEEHLNANLPIDNYETLSGFMLGQLNTMPERHEKIKFIYNNWIFEGLSYNGLVITKVKITQKENIISLQEETEL